MGKILLYGYYGFKNFGDDLFEHSFQKLLKTLTDHDIITVYKRNFKDAPPVDYIFLGGGEIINEFFMYNLFEYIDRHKLYHVPIFGASIGFNEKENGPIEFCDFFDKCIFRDNLERIIDDKHFFYDHDIVMYPKTAGIKKFQKSCEKLKSYVTDEKKKTKKTAGLYLIPFITVEQYEEIFKFILYLVNESYFIHFIFFDCKHDRKLMNQIEKRFVEENIDVKYKVTDTTDFETKFLEIAKCDLHFCMRYHAHMICLHMKVPFISFPVPSKTKKFCLNFDIPYGESCDDFIKLMDQKKHFYNKKIVQEPKYHLIKNFFKMTKGYDKRKTKWFQIYRLFKNWNKTNNYGKASLLDCIINFYSPSLEFDGICEKIQLLEKEENPSAETPQNRILQIITDAIPDIYEFNPTIYSDDEVFFFLVRQETNIKKWSSSTLSYKMYQKNNDTIVNHTIFFEINGKIYEKIHRDNKDGIPLIEDVKLFPEREKSKLYGICNVLTTIRPQYLFSVGMIELDVEKKIIKLLKIFDIKEAKKEKIYNTQDLDPENEAEKNVPTMNENFDEKEERIEILADSNDANEGGVLQKTVRDVKPEKNDFGLSDEFRSTETSSTPVLCLNKNIESWRDSKKSKELNISEKNWYFLKMKDTFYVIYKIFPLIIYEFDITNFDLKPYVTIDTVGLLKTKYRGFTKNISKTYKDVYMSLVWGHFDIKNNVITTLARKKEKKLNYKYYPIKIYWNDCPEKIYFEIEDKVLFEGKRLYVNDIKIIYVCAGLKDQRFKIIKK